MTTLVAPPPAPATPPPPMTPGGRSAVRVALVVVAALVVVGAVITLAATAWGISSFRVITDTKPLPAAMRSLVVDTDSVPALIRITADPAAREPRVDLRMVNSIRAAASPLAVNADGAGARVTLEAESTPFLNWGRAGELTVVLPPDLARRLAVTVQAQNGRVSTQADLDQVVARTDNGDVVLSGAARRVEVHTDNGDVTTRQPVRVAESFTATTANGAVSVDFSGSAPRTVDVTSDNGDIVVGLPTSGPYLVDVTGVEGNGNTVVRVPQTGDRAAAAGVITVRSANGDITVEGTRR